MNFVCAYPSDFQNHFESTSNGSTSVDSLDSMMYFPPSCHEHAKDHFSHMKPNSSHFEYIEDCFNTMDTDSSYPENKILPAKYESPPISSEDGSYNEFPFRNGNSFTPFSEYEYNNGFYLSSNLATPMTEGMELVTRPLLFLIECQWILILPTCEFGNRTGNTHPFKICGSFDYIIEQVGHIFKGMNSQCYLDTLTSIICAITSSGADNGECMAAIRLVTGEIAALKRLRNNVPYILGVECITT